MSAAVVATLTEDNRVHEVVCDHFKGEDHYSLMTAVDGKHIAMRTLTRDEFVEWCEIAEKGGTP